MKHCSICHRSYKDGSNHSCRKDSTLRTSIFGIDASLNLDDSSQLEATITIGDEPSPTRRPARAKSPSTTKSFIDDPVIAISVNEQYPHCKRKGELYTCTRGVWRLNVNRAQRAKYAFAVYKGEIKEVFEIDRWQPATQETINFWSDRLQSQNSRISASDLVGRYEFIGHEAPEEIRKKYVGRTLPRSHKGNPIMYFNC